MNKNKVIPRVKFDIDENNPLSGLKVVSIVDEPAIMSNAVYLNKVKEKKMFIELKGENFKQVVCGLILIPDLDILRFDALGEPFYGYFTKQSVEKIRNKFHKEGLTDMVNTDHDSKSYIDAFLITSFIIDSEEMLSAVKAKGIEEATIGSWYVEYKIEDAETFKRVVSGELNGFSAELFLGKFYKQVGKDQPDNNNLNVFENVMNKFLEKFKQLLSEMEAEKKPEEVKTLESAKTADGKSVEYGAVGEAVTVDGETPADGDIILDNGKTITIASGVVSEIKDTPSVEVEQKKEEKAEKEQLNKTIADLKAEVEKLKKAPLVKPVVKEKEEQPVDFSKLSNADKFRMRQQQNKK